MDQVHSKMAVNNRIVIKDSLWNWVLEIAVRIVLFAVFLILEETTPFVRKIHDEELWLYKNPRASNDVVPTPALFIIAICAPSLVILILSALRKDRVDATQAILGLTLSLGLNGVITNTVKILVGRPRPDFFLRCYPNGLATADLQCNGNPDDIMEGRKSFPSGHSSWAFSGLAFLAIYLAGKLHCFQGQGHGQRHGQGWKLCLAVLPILGATAIALTRYSDYKHHWQDVTVGSLLGLCLAMLCYRQYYPALDRPHCHLPYSSLFQLKQMLEEHDHLLPLSITADIQESLIHPMAIKSL